MHLAALRLGDFRSWADVTLELAPGPVVFVGPNGQGKTNLVEAVGYLATLSSHRVATDAPLVRRDATRAVIRARLVRDTRELLVECEINPAKANRVRVNRSPLPRPRELLGLVRTVLFAPEDLALVRGDPGERRRFLDELLVTRSPRFAAVRQDYDRILKQRNALLKTARHARGDALGTLEVWDGHLARVGAQLWGGRLALIDALAPYLGEAYAGIAGSDDADPGAAEISYRASRAEQPGAPAGPGSAGAADRTASERHEGTPGDIGRHQGTPDAVDAAADEPAADEPAADLEAALLAALGRVRREELDRGITLVGPHRDDLVLTLGEHPAKGYASHGESWSFALSLKLAAYELLRSDGVEPILILDDVFAELDTRRRARLSEIAARAEQVLITAAVSEDVPDSVQGRRFVVGDGEVRADPT